mgnify:CR=1 FL=1
MEIALPLDGGNQVRWKRDRRAITKVLADRGLLYLADEDRIRGSRSKTEEPAPRHPQGL